jgi:alpha-tubulin suppressor-like RCC1 family protein
MAIIEVHNSSNDETYLMSAGQNFDGLLGQGNDEPISAEFKPLDYDHKKIKFVKVSLLTRHAMAISESGELYGWGSNQDQRLALEGVAASNKPTLLPRLNDKARFKILDIACGDDHSFVHVKETDSETNQIRYRTYQIGFNEEETNSHHRGGLTKEQLLIGGGIAPVPMLENVIVKLMTCGTKTSFF